MHFHLEDQYRYLTEYGGNFCFENQLSANSYIVIYCFKIDIRMKCGVIAVFLIEMKMKYFYVTLN